jgi:hypothetical protein
MNLLLCWLLLAFPVRLPLPDWMVAPIQPEFCQLSELLELATERELLHGMVPRDAASTSFSLRQPSEIFRDLWTYKRELDDCPALIECVVLPSPQECRDAFRFWDGQTKAAFNNLLANPRNECLAAVYKFSLVTREHWEQMSDATNTDVSYRRRRLALRFVIDGR